MLPCMEGVLPRVFLEHAACLVAAVYRLNKRSITEEDLRKSSELLVRFHKNFVILYGMELYTTLK